MSKTIELARHLETLHINDMYKTDFYWTWDKTDDEIDAVFTVADALRDLRERNKSTRIFDSGTPVVAASANRRMCGIWVALHMVTCSPVGSTTTLRGSMKAGINRCWRYSRSITMPPSRAFAIAASTSPPVPASPESKTQ